MKKIVPCMDISGGRVVKGVKFEGMRDVGDPVEFASFYDKSGADELVFYDIMASVEGRSLFYELFKRVAEEVSIPLTAGGGIRCVADVEYALECGAGKVSINSGAIADRTLIKNAASRFKSERVILAMDVKRFGGGFRVFKAGGREDTGLDAVEWAYWGESEGAGELVINSIDADGVKEGFDLELLAAIAERVNIPIVASGGAGTMEHFAEALAIEGVDAGLGASVFHFKEIDIRELKRYLVSRGIEVSI